MWVFALEALVALSLLVLIVWLTMSKPRRHEDESARTDKSGPDERK